MLQPNAGRDEEAAFLEIQEFLEALGLPVPRVYAHDRSQGIVVLEDLGDNLLESVVGRASRAELRAIYGEAVKLLLRMRMPQATYLVRAFDQILTAKLMEDALFLIHFVQGLCKTKPQPPHWKTFSRHLRTMAQPRIFTHWDFIKKLIPKESPLQCWTSRCRMGLPNDPASLLRDLYVNLPEELPRNSDRLYDEIGKRESRNRFR
jgi:aminoglycoside/choline kinase family phosphotransferase